MIHVTCRLTAKNRDQLRNPTLDNRVRATFTLPDLENFAMASGSRCQQNSPTVKSVDDIYNDSRRGQL